MKKKTKFVITILIILFVATLIFIPITKTPTFKARYYLNKEKDNLNEIVIFMKELYIDNVTYAKITCDGDLSIEKNNKFFTQDISDEKACIALNDLMNKYGSKNIPHNYILSYRYFEDAQVDYDKEGNILIRLNFYTEDVNDDKSTRYYLVYKEKLFDMNIKFSPPDSQFLINKDLKHLTDNWYLGKQTGYTG